MADEVANKVAFELVTPTALAISEDVDMVVVPGSEGDFGVLPGHTPILSTVRPGVINMYTDGVITKSLFVEGGFAEANPERCTVLAESATDVSELSSSDTEARLSAAREVYSSADDEAKEAAEKELRIAEEMVRAAGGNSTLH
ncbi:MAG TPA: ATP synthase F1 subunit epsilon [Rhodospirillales bacterium]|jgi:F-type H+-transporting ATPase subunit epsilon|nr:ATP synthase F1 subunit epsilon [Rhodospirillales bacterium]MDP7424913.1 ATP synthase F1 subunit epsilon [Rhodospirillales bacterium]HJO85525.1 ATP synthase F1 subunit epsilon [Rhodospirillales bacterium]|tara:strand:+ start:3278 stop:3706 length:429 start_codon:yes stop_codon:yes gene_type:complete